MTSGNNKSEIFFIARSGFSLKNIIGGYEERIYGEYVGYVRKYGGQLYSLDQRTLFGPELHESGSFGIIRFIVWSVVKIARSKNKGVFVMAYPSIMRVVFIIPFLFFLKAFGLLKIVISVHDLYLEQKEAFSRRKIRFARFLIRAIDRVCLKLLADAVTVVSPTLKNYLCNMYRVAPENVHVLPNSSFPEIIRPAAFPSDFTILYSGSLMTGKGVEDLVSLVRRLRAKKLEIELLLLGGLHMPLPQESWIEVACVPFLRTSDFYDHASVCVIPFPKNLHFDYATPIKLFDYMAAAKPIVSLDLEETSRILKDYSCGIAVRNYEEMAKAIEYLYMNRQVAKTLGENGRKAVESEFNWAKRVNELNTIIRNLP